MSERVYRDRRAYWAANRERYSAARAIYYEDNAEEMRERSRAYYEANKEQVLARQKASKAKRNALGRHRTKERLACIERHGDRCFYCGVGGELETDHVIPISRGGTNAPENLVPACKSCNARKGTLTADEFVARQNRIESLRAARAQSLRPKSEV